MSKPKPEPKPINDKPVKNPPPMKPIKRPGKGK